MRPTGSSGPGRVSGSGITSSETPSSSDSYSELSSSELTGDSSDELLSGSADFSAAVAVGLGAGDRDTFGFGVDGFARFVRDCLGFLVPTVQRVSAHDSNA